MEAENEMDQNDFISQNTSSSSSEKGPVPELFSEDTLNPDPGMAEDEDGEDNENEEQDDKMEMEFYDDDEFSDDEDYEDYELDESEIDMLLEQPVVEAKAEADAKRAGEKEKNVGERLTRTEKSREHGNEVTIKKIVILEEKGGNTFEVMPSGWIQARHSSGMPVYLHRKTRVCCISKPYYLGPASVRRHSIPISGIPCLAYRRALEKDQKDKELLETQVKELESQQVEAPIAPERSQSLDLLTKCLNATSGKDRSKKCPYTSTDTLSEKLKAQKRKMEGKEAADKAKKGKQETASSTGDTADQQVCVPSEQTASVAVAEPVLSSSTESGKAGSLTSANLQNVGPQHDDNESNQNPTAPRSNMKKTDKNIGGMKTLMPLAKVETARENASLYSVTPGALRDYCQSLFQFREVECKRFKTWSARRRHTKEQKRKQLERPSLPDNAQVIKFFDLNSAKVGDDEPITNKFHDYVFNPNGKSSVCILHEFVQHALRKQPTYAFLELENAATPYSATVLINEVAYGKGYGSSKKTAKAEAAKATLEILIPQMKGQLNGNKKDPSSDFDITEYFEQVDMSDPRISKMCTSVSEPSPYSLLLTCLQRSFGKTESSHVKFDMLPADLSKGNASNQFKMSAGPHAVTVSASNKKEGKQLASQLLLSKMHPHITNFGAFIKMYGNRSIKSVKEKKQEEQQITTLQSKASANSPNWAILNKLRQEMLKLAEHEKGREGVGTSTDRNNMVVFGPSVNQTESDGNIFESANIS